MAANQEFFRMELSGPQWQPSAGFGHVAFLAISEGAGGGSYRLFSSGFWQYYAKRMVHPFLRLTQKANSPKILPIQSIAYVRDILRFSLTGQSYARSASFWAFILSLGIDKIRHPLFS
jgi:hypothetical protein